MFERFTDRARRVVVHAQDEARRLCHSYIGTEHILLGIVYEEPGGLAVRVLETLGVSGDAVRERVEAAVPAGQHEPGAGHIPFTPRAKKVLELSLREALELEHNYIGTEHILLGLIREGEGPAYQVLSELGVHRDRVRELVIEFVTAAQEGMPKEERAGRATRTARLTQPRLRDEVLDRLDSIAVQLQRIEQRLGIEAPEPPVAGELDRLRAEVARLTGLLREHGIDPGSGRTGDATG